MTKIWFEYNYDDCDDEENEGDVFFHGVSWPHKVSKTIYSTNHRWLRKEWFNITSVLFDTCYTREYIHSCVGTYRRTDRHTDAIVPHIYIYIYIVHIYII